MISTNMTTTRHRFATDSSGTVALTFSLTIFAILGAAALGLDYSRALQARTRLQSAIDAAALSADPNNTTLSTTLNDRVVAAVNFNLQGQTQGLVNLQVNATAVPTGVQVQASADVPTSFGRVFGVTKLPINVFAEAVSAQSAFEIALVLDNTYSMVGNKLSTLKTSSKALIENISATGGSSVKFALVPFSNYVNVGMANRQAKWMSVPNDWVETVNYSYQTTDWDGCPQTTSTYTCYNDGVPGSCTASTCTTPGPLRTVAGSYQVQHQWNGCAGSRTPAVDLAPIASFSAPVPGILDVGCPSPLTRLTSDTVSMETQIDAMVAQGETYIASGLMWGWRVLSPDAPFADAAGDTGPPTRKIMILMTDGSNTKSQLGTNHEGGDQVSADGAMTSLCSLITQKNQLAKDKKAIELYAVAFTVTDAPTKQRLQDCASDTDHFFDAADTSGLRQAFSQISRSLTRLSLSR